MNYASWKLCGYPLENLPTNLQLDNLIKLSMQYSNIRKLWEGTKSLSNLKGIDLRWSEHLIEIPDLSGAPNLERLNLEGCKNLTKGKSRGHERILGSTVAHGMPDWFTTRSSGSSVTLEMHQNLDGRLGDFLLLQTPDVASVGPIGFWAFIPVEWFLEQSNNWEGWSYIRASIAVDSMDPSTDSSIVEVKECGARLLYEGDALEFSNAVRMVGIGLLSTSFWS
ncbi:Protein SUPPRESSOR OF npr1-1, CONSTITUTIVE 1 [Morella rubra]|uniref:Protein SUPPRESSOR OF npr1-1, CONSTITUTIVE 1 n=1 Tax=Morella rubra TaxID=262757 RepID=A0A6A1ULC1_9ROSI|nr:Protein SUPPRESSOR OF npr1-1, CONSTITUTIVE 1 [Morella rubra]